MGKPISHLEEVANILVQSDQSVAPCGLWSKDKESYQSSRTDKDYDLRSLR